jgi:arylsulfatase A-like enzyme
VSGPRDDRGRSREATYGSALLIGAGAVLALVTVGVDWIKGSGWELGPIQRAGLGLGAASIVLGIVFLRVPLARRIAARLWPFGQEAPGSPPAILALAVWLAVLGGVLEAALSLLRFALGWSWGTLNPHAFWMVPAIDAATLVALAAPLAAFAWLGFPHLGSPRFAAFVLLLVAVGAPLSLFKTELRWLSVVLLTLGIAFQGARILAHRWRGLWSWMRRSAVPLAALLGLAAVAPTARQAWAERSGLAEMPTPPPRSPSVILIVLDTVRAQNMSLYGYARRTTPWLERIALEGAVFDRAYAPSTWTLPSHGSLFTGRPPHQQSGNSFTPLDDALPTLAEVFRDRGYYTLGIVANDDNAYPHTGLDRGFLRYDTHTTAFWEMLEASRIGAVWRWGLRRFGIDLPTRKDADTINGRFLDDLDRRGERPFFAFLNYYDAHYPFDDPLPPFSSIEGWAENPVEVVGKMYPEATRHVDDYDREIAHLDDRLEALFSELDGLGVLEDTIVIVTSDHGEEFTEHGFLGHGFNVYDTTLHVPLLVYGPRLVPAARVDRPVALQDLPATIMELVGLAEGSPFLGRSLLAEASEPAADPPALSEVAVSQPGEETPAPWNFRSLVEGDLHYIRNPNRSEELYDLASDPWETRDLADGGEDPRLGRFRSALSTMIDETVVSRGEPQGE